MFTEEFQVQFLEEYHKVFDKARQHSLIGELVWNFADFVTGQGNHGLYCVMQLMSVIQVSAY